MTKVKCKCGYTENVEWRISAFGLIDCSILFRCKVCGEIIKVIISFSDDGRGKVEEKVEYNSLAYIG